MVKDAKGFAWIDMPHSAIGFRGVVYDDGPSLVLDGSSAQEHPFGCYRSEFDAPVELEPEASRQCVEQAIMMTLDDRAGVWAGTVTFAIYKKRVEARPSSSPSTLPPPMQPRAGWTVEKVTWPVQIAPASWVGKRPPKR